MKKQRLDNANNTVIGHLNINLFSNKFVFVKDIIKLFDAFLVSESKLDHTFPSNQFRINGYETFSIDRNRFGGGLILYINKNIRRKPLQEHVNKANCEVIAIEFYQNNQKWLLFGLYKPPNQKTNDFIQNLSLILDLYFKNYDNVTLIGDLSSDDVPSESFLQAYNLTSLIKEATCFQSSNPSCINLIIPNQKNVCKLFNTFETGISDHQKLISTVTQFGSFKGRPRQKIYRSYRSLNIETNKKTLSDKLSRLESNSYSEFEKAFLTVLNKQALLRTKFLRHNNNPFMTKELRKAIMKRSQLKKKDTTKTEITKTGIYIKNKEIFVKVF